MSIIEIFIISLALSMDAFAVTVSNLMANPNLSRGRRLTMPITFGVFQGLMLLIGFFAGYLAVGFIQAYAGPVAMVILFVIGGRMIFEAVRDMRRKRAEIKDNKERAGVQDALEALEATETLSDAPVEKPASLSLPTILAQGVATSLDALIVGVSLAALSTNIIIAAPMVGVTTFLICLLGLVIGKRLGALLGGRAQFFGGVILILIGIKVCFF